MKLIMVRHGESDHNVNDLVQGHTPSKLTPKGKFQAKSVANFLKTENINKIYSSDLTRAKETAEIINESFNKDLQFFKVLRERSFGDYENGSFEDFHKAVAESNKKYHQFKPKNGESCEEKGEKMMEFINQISKENEKNTVLIVTHGGNILEVLFRGLNLSRENYKEYNPRNCAVTILELGANGKFVKNIISQSIIQK